MIVIVVVFVVVTNFDVILGLLSIHIMTIVNDNHNKSFPLHPSYALTHHLLIPWLSQQKRNRHG